MKLKIKESNERIRKSIQANVTTNNPKLGDYFKIPVKEILKQIQKISPYSIGHSYPSYSREGSKYTGIHFQIQAGNSSLVEIDINLKTDKVVIYTWPNMYSDDEYMELQKKAVDIIADNVRT